MQKYFSLLLTSLLFLGVAFGDNNPRGTELGVVRLYPLIQYKPQVRKSDEKDETVNSFGGRATFKEGKSKLKLEQTLGATYTKSNSKSLDYIGAASILYDTGSRFSSIFKAERKAVTNIVGEQRFLNENRNYSTRYQLVSLYDTNSHTSAELKFQAIDEKIVLENNTIGLESLEATTNLKYNGNQKTLARVYGKKVKSIDGVNIVNRETDEVGLDFATGPFAKTLFGLGYSYLVDDTKQMEHSPYVLSIINFSPKSFLELKFGQTFSNRNNKIWSGQAKFKRKVSSKTDLYAWYRRGYIRDPLLNVQESYEFGFQLRQKVSAKLTFDLKAYGLPQSGGQDVDEFAYTSLIWDYHRNMGLELGLTYSNVYQLLTLTLNGFI